MDNSYKKVIWEDRSHVLSKDKLESGLRLWIAKYKHINPKDGSDADGVAVLLKQEPLDSFEERRHEMFCKYLKKSFAKLCGECAG